MRRPFTLVAGILGTVIFSIFSILLVAELTTIDYFFITVGEIIMLTIFSLFEITSLILNAISISAYENSNEVYNKKRPLLLTTIVFNFIVAALFFATMSFGSDTSTIILFLILIFALIAVNVFYILDLSLENKKQNDFACEETTKKITQSISDEIERLADLRNRKILSQSEFETLKKEMIKQQTKKQG